MRPFRTNIREGSAGFEVFSAVTLMCLALASAFDPHPTTSLVVLLLSLSYPGVWLALIFAMGVLHLFALARWSVLPWIAIRKVCSVIGMAIYCGLIADVLTVRPNIGAVIWLGTIVVFLSVAIFRRTYGVT